jgi:hypothetical protein
MRRHPTQFPIRLALVLALILLAGAGATPASAGEYPVYACEPSQGDVNNSWQAYSNRRGILVYVACRGRPGALGPWDQGLVTRAMINRRNKGATIRKGASARLAFTAPPGATLSRISYVGSLCGTAGHIALLQADVIPVTFGFSQPPADCPSKAPTGSTVPLFGKTTVSLRTACALKRCSVGGGRPRAWAALRSATVYVSDNTPPSVSVTGGAGLAPGWKRGAVDVRFGAGDNVGIRYAKLDAAGATSNETRPSCDYTRPAPCTNLNSAFTVNTRAIPDGEQAFVLSAEDAAGNWASQPFTLRVDNTAPGPPLGLAVVGGAQWRARNAFSIEWRNPSQAGTAPIAGVWTAVCPAVSDVEDWSACVVGPQRTPDEVASGIEVPRSGMWVARVWLQDAAGNEDRQTAQAVPLNFDDTPPTVDIAPMDIADPTRIDVHASDVISPLARIEIEVRRRGKRAWIGLPATVTATGFSARLDDEALPDGTYELRARATDSAGNERSTYREPSGNVAMRRVPTRVDTRLVAGQIKIIKARRARGRRRRARRVVVVRPKVLYGRTIPIRGRLTMAGGNAVANAAIEVWEQPRIRGAVSERIAVIGTDASGRFTFRALRGPSRTLRFRYPGTAIVRARSTEVELRVRGSSTIGVNRRRVVNGEDIVLRGRIRGGPLPVGKLVQLQAYSRGRWLTFATPRASRGTGRWSYRYRFTATRGTVKYRFRVRLPQEAGFPYISGVSRSVRVLVRGL